MNFLKTCTVLMAISLSSAVNALGADKPAIPASAIESNYRSAMRFCSEKTDRALRAQCEDDATRRYNTNMNRFQEKSSAYKEEQFENKIRDIADSAAQNAVNSQPRQQ